MIPGRPPMTALRQRMRDDLELRNYSAQTIRAYLHGVAAFARYFHLSPEHLGPEHVRAYQLYLVQQKHVAWATFNQIVCALRFFYQTTLGVTWMIEHIPYPRRQKKLPKVLSRAEVAALLTTPRNLKHRAMLTTLYAAGLRVSELCALQVPDIESQRMVIRVRQGKGQRDRLVMLAPRLLQLLRQYWKQYRPPLWLFPGRVPTTPIAPDSVWRMCRHAGEVAQFPYPVFPHMLRHSFATHMLEDGVDLRRLQLLLGHRRLDTTSLYLHVASGTLQATPSPLEHPDVAGVLDTLL
jgi:integrase/recombinase XerD